jgi:hypothetical protein
MDLGVDANKTAFRYVNCSLLVPQLCVVLWNVLFLILNVITECTEILTTFSKAKI